MNFQDKNIENGDSSSEQNERLLDLMVQLSTSGLSESEQHELDDLVSTSNSSNTRSTVFNIYDPESFELSAAALDLSMLGEREEMPDNVRDRVLFDAGQHFRSDTVTRAIDSANVSSNAPADAKVELASRSSNGFTWRESVATAMAAASILLLLSGWNPFAQTGNTETGIAKTDGTTKVQPIVLTAAEKLARFVNSNHDDMVREAWQQLDKRFIGASGEVLWSDSAQEGYMVFTDIAPNDPLVEQFQLWIFDTDKAQDHPVDGGVFDIASSEYGPDGKIVVPIKAHIPVEEAVMFAVTVERPGGVTVSKRECIPVLAEKSVAKN
ncbi:MAG: anti-sigma factor [Mariniblastus sp.]